MNSRPSGRRSDELRLLRITRHYTKHAAGSVLRGETVQTLADATEESAADLVIIATHARAGLDATLTGSIAASLIGRVTQPVLMIKIGARD